MTRRRANPKRYGRKSRRRRGLTFLWIGRLYGNKRIWKHSGLKGWWGN